MRREIQLKKKRTSTVHRSTTQFRILLSRASKISHTRLLAQIVSRLMFHIYHKYEEKKLENIFERNQQFKQAKFCSHSLSFDDALIQNETVWSQSDAKLKCQHDSDVLFL